MRFPDGLKNRAALLHQSIRSIRGVYKLGVLIFFITVAFFYAVALQPPRDFPRGVIVEIKSGFTAREVAATLEKNNLIISPFWFTSVVVLLIGEDKIMAGNYFFPEPRNALSIAWRLSHGDYRLEPLRVTFPEGSTVRDIADILADRLYEFDVEKFRILASGKEGYLFPDTYYFLPISTPEDVIERMTSTFLKKIEPLGADIERFGKSLHEIVTMASLLEKEARIYETRQTIAGILWRRITIGMPLQVDATFLYINGKNTFQLTTEDLAIDSPYNTYRYKGLPVGPIANPGLASIKAAINPIPSPYLFYLADNRGVTHYSRTFAEHVAKKRIYLP